MRSAALFAKPWEAEHFTPGATVSRNGGLRDARRRAPGSVWGACERDRSGEQHRDAPRSRHTTLELVDCAADSSVARSVVPAAPALEGSISST